MSLDLHRESAESAVQALLAKKFPGVPVKFQNAAFAQPETTWCAFFILDGKGIRANLGPSSIIRMTGFLQLDILVPANGGTKVAYQITDSFGKAFQNQRVALSDGAVIRYREQTDTKALGAQEGFYRVMTRVTYWRDEPSSDGA